MEHLSSFASQIEPLKEAILQQINRRKCFLITLSSQKANLSFQRNGFSLVGNTTQVSFVLINGVRLSSIVLILILLCDHVCRSFRKITNLIRSLIT
jgi:hypothetical protein